MWPLAIMESIAPNSSGNVRTITVGARGISKIYIRNLTRLPIEPNSSEGNVE